MELIGEIGTNHNGNYEECLKLVDMAKRTGLDTVKLQIYEANDIVSPRVKCEHYNLQSEDYTYWEDYINARLITPHQWVPSIVEYCRSAEIDIIVTAHSLKLAEYCLNSGIERLKVASMDFNHHTFIRELCSLDVPLMVSTGMSTFDEIKETVGVIKKFDIDLTLFHCVSTYPTSYKEANLGFFSALKELDVDKLGLSDHSTNNDLVKLSIPFGVSVIEKHITLDKTQNGPDHPFALNEEECKEWRRSVDNSLLALGETGVKTMSEKEWNNRDLFRRHLIVNKDLEKGQILTKDDIYFARSHPVDYQLLDLNSSDYYVDKPLKTSIQKDMPLGKKHFQ